MGQTYELKWGSFSFMIKNMLDWKALFSILKLKLNQCETRQEININEKRFKLVTNNIDVSFPLNPKLYTERYGSLFKTVAMF